MTDLVYIDEATMVDLGVLADEALPAIWQQVEDGLVAVAEGRVDLPLDAYLRSSETGHFDRIIAKAGRVKEIAGVKWIASAPANLEVGLPRANGLLILNEARTGRPYALMDAVPVSNLRTAAVVIAFLRALGRDPRRLVVVGAGIHGREHARQIAAAERLGVFPSLRDRFIVDPDRAAAERFADLVPGIEVADGLEACLDHDALVVLTTNALAPWLGRELVDGLRGLSFAHTSLRDLTPPALAAFDLCLVDSFEHVARASTSVDLAIREGLLDSETCQELPHWLVRRRNGESLAVPPEANVVFNPMGLAVSDLVVGDWIVDRARAAGRGTQLGRG